MSSQSTLLENNLIMLDFKLVFEQYTRQYKTYTNKNITVCFKPQGVAIIYIDQVDTKQYVYKHSLKPYETMLLINKLL